METSTTDKQDDNEKENGDNAVVQETLDKLSGIMDGLPKLITDGLEKGFAGVGDKVSQATQNQNDDDDKDEPVKQDVDFENMDRKQMVEHATENIVNIVTKQITDAKKELTEQITSTSDEVSKEKLRREVDEARKTFEDFDSYQEEIKKELGRNPSLSVTDLYHLAKANNPDRVKELEEKKQETKEKEEKEKKPKFGGLTPTSSLETTNKGTMTRKEASESAWDEVMTDIDPSLIGGNNN